MSNQNYSFIFVISYGLITEQRYKIIIKIGNKTISKFNKLQKMNRFTVKLRGEKIGAYCYQVALNCACDICDAMAENIDFTESMVTINNKPLSFWLGR